MRWYYHSSLMDEGMRHSETEVSLVHFGSLTWNATVLRSSDLACNIFSFQFFPVTSTAFGCSFKASSLASRLWETTSGPLDKPWIGLTWHRQLSSVRWHSVCVTLIQTIKQPFWFLNLLPHSLLIFHLLQQVKQKSYEQHPSVHFN